MDDYIHTDAAGRPIPGRPDPLKPGATYLEWRTWVRAERAWRDRVTDSANRAFVEAFDAAMRRQS